MPACAELKACRRIHRNNEQNASHAKIKSRKARELSKVQIKQTRSSQLDAHRSKLFQKRIMSGNNFSLQLT